MQMDDLLAACLDAQEHGRSPSEILDRALTLDQRGELESLLALAERVRRLTPPALKRETREAMAARLAVTMRMPLAAHPARTWV